MRKGKTWQPKAKNKGRTRQQAQGIPLGIGSTSTNLSCVGFFFQNLFKEHLMPHDKLYLDIILSVPGLLSSHRDWHQAQDTFLPALFGQDCCFLRASHPEQKTPSASTCTRRAVKYSWRCFPARSKTQAVTVTQEVLNRDLMEEEVSRHKSVIYSDAFQALTAAEMQVESQVPPASPRLYMLQFPPNSPGSAGSEQSQHQAQPALTPSHPAAPAGDPSAGRLSR